jgi:hypothetical protein
VAGITNAQIAEQLGIKPDSVRHLINRTLRTAENRAAEEMRELENARLDRAQAAIWTQVLARDYRAVMVFLQISARRARLNGLGLPGLGGHLAQRAQGNGAGAGRRFAAGAGRRGRAGR